MPGLLSSSGSVRVMDPIFLFLRSVTSTHCVRQTISSFMILRVEAASEHARSNPSKPHR